MVEKYAAEHILYLQSTKKILTEKLTAKEHIIQKSNNKIQTLQHQLSDYTSQLNLLKIHLTDLQQEIEIKNATICRLRNPFKRLWSHIVKRQS